MRTEKEVKEKILELKSKFLDEEEKQLSLRDLRIRLKVLKWVLGENWNKQSFARMHGARLK